MYFVIVAKMGDVYQNVASILTVLESNFAKRGNVPTPAKGHEIAL